MIWFIIVPIIVGILFASNGWDGWETLGFGLLGLLIGGMTAMLINLAISIPEYTTQKNLPVQKLVSLNVGNELNGKQRQIFFVGSGYINQKLTYIYYIQNSDGTYELKQRAADNTLIKETTDTPSIQCTQNVSWVSADTWATVFSGMTDTTPGKCTLTIPPGSIKSIINPNLPQVQGG